MADLHKIRAPVTLLSFIVCAFKIYKIYDLSHSRRPRQTLISHLSANVLTGCANAAWAHFVKVPLIIQGVGNQPYLSYIPSHLCAEASLTRLASENFNNKCYQVI
jgi:hypothetical protein